MIKVIVEFSDKTYKSFGEEHFVEKNGTLTGINDIFEILNNLQFIPIVFDGDETITYVNRNNIRSIKIA